ncbi:hypothetical protein CEP51_008314 [Fusarium floridanum]|uniref:Uncharacterized protein n=1 Tax=Fusarium floridanum TaxID=1325733 RepID=A0A428RLD0_9HYPO|nr:hypothetical protein CEP51_008314 [Fusarium floridanum]
MCYQLVERYSVCRCLYYQHAIDRCAAYGRPGHYIEQRTIFVSYDCSTHSSSNKPDETKVAFRNISTSFKGLSSKGTDDMESTSREFHSDTFLSDDDDDDATGGNNVRLETESDDIPVSTSRQHIPAGHSDLELEPNESQASYSAAPGIASFSQTSASTESHAKHAITQREQQSSITWSPKNDNQLRSVTSYEVPGTINGIPVEALPDWGSAIEAISEAFARQHGFSIDATGTQTIRLPGGNITESVGRVVGDFKFQRESDVYQCQFHVLRDSVFDLVLGRRFLDLTKTLTDFSHRIVERVRPCYQKGSRLFLMGESPKDRLRCVVNGFEASALPDTGSELMLCSGDFVRRHGFTVHKGKKYQRQVVLIDGSTMRTDGMVTGAELQFDAPPVSSPSLDCSLYLSFITGLASLTSCKGNAPRKATFICDLYVIESLPYDIILSNEFIFQYGVFSRFQHLFYSTSPSTSPDEQASVDNSLLFIRTRRPGRLSRRQPPQTETNTISFQGGLSWERRWEVEEARRNRAMLRIASLPEPQNLGQGQPKATTGRAIYNFAKCEENASPWSTFPGGTCINRCTCAVDQVIDRER